MKAPANAIKRRSGSINGHTLLMLITIVLFISALRRRLHRLRRQKLHPCADVPQHSAFQRGPDLRHLRHDLRHAHRGIDISVGSLIALDCMILAMGMGDWGFSAVVSMVLVLVLGIAFGLFQGFCVGYLQIQPFIVTMAGMFFARGMTAVISTDQLSITAESSQWFYDLANYRIYLPFGGYVNKAGKMVMPYIGWGVVVAFVVLIAIFLVLRYTRFGRSLYAVGGNEQSAAMMGLNVKKTKMLAYVLLPSCAPSAASAMP